MIQDSQPSRISVLLITFNHAAYIAKSVESILSQNIDDKFDIIVADDGSTDDTVALLKEYAEQNEHIRFLFLDNSMNLGITRNYLRAFRACQSEYVAVMEGDDYWVSPDKLKKQRDFLDIHWECDLCSANYYVYEEDLCRFTLRVPIVEGYNIFGARELIADNVVGNFSTCMYRLTALRRLPPKLFDIRSYDWAINICIGREGLIAFLHEPMSVYRIHGRGAWSLLSQTAKLQAQLELIPAYDEVTDRVFHADFSALAERLEGAVTGRQISQLVTPVVVPIARSFPQLIDLVPPVFVSLIKALLPPVVKRYLIRLVMRGQA